MAKSAQAEVQRIKELEARIKAPSVWGRMPMGLRFEDLQERRIDDAVKFLRKHYLTEELPLRCVKLAEDEEGSSEYLNQARIWMRDKMSIAAIKEDTDKLVGVMIMRIQEKSAFSRTFSRVKITYNPRLTIAHDFLKAVETPVDVFEELGVRRYLKIYAMGVKPRYRHRGVILEMLKAAMEVCKSAFLPAMAAVFCTTRLQLLAEKLGFEKYNEIYYIKYLINDQVMFADVGKGNHGAVFMALRIPEIVELEPERKEVAPRFQIAGDQS